jgi:hypothetical protein
MFNLTTNSIINSRDIIWLNKTYGEWKNNKTTISTVEDDNIGLLTGIDKMKLTTNATKYTLALFSTEIVKEPTTYEEAINSEQKEDQIKWKNSIDKVLKEVEKRNVWEIIDEKDIPIDFRCIKNTWIFKVKRNGIFRARLVACVYSQIPGIDFIESFAPVLNDVSFRIILIAKLLWNMTCSVVDI